MWPLEWNKFQMKREGGLFPFFSFPGIFQLHTTFWKGGIGLAIEAIMQKDIWEAKHRISSTIQKTPLVYSPILSERAKGSIYLKLENLQDRKRTRLNSS